MKLAPFGIVGKEVIRDPWKAAENYIKVRGKYEELVGDELFEEMKKVGLAEDFFHDFMIALCKIQIKRSFSQDKAIIKAIDLLDSIKKIKNYLFESLVEYYGLYNPEVVYKIDLDRFLQIKNLRERSERSMGYDLLEDDIKNIEESYSLLKEIAKEEEKLRNRIEKIMKKFYPNLSTVATPIIGARLISLAGSMKKLVEMPSSTIQVLGAEKALFRHLRTGAKPPKYGVLVSHPLVVKAKKKGKIARILASKISIATRVDYFGGKFIGDKLLEEVKE